MHASVPTVSHGSGIYLWDTSQRKYLDAASGAVAAILGHAHPGPIAAIAEQSTRVSHVYRGTFTSEPTEHLGQMLIDRTHDQNGKVQFANSGSEAVEIAMKTAIQYWQELGRSEKWRVLSRRHSYHGNTVGSLSLSGSKGRRDRFGPLIHPFPMIEAPDPTDPQSVEDFDVVMRREGSDSIAAIIIEPITGASSPALVPPAGYLQRLREICDEHNVLLIADEVMSGMYRAGEFLFLEASGVTADITTLGKGLGAGYAPLSAVIISNRVVQAFDGGSGKLDTGGHTYSANPMAAAVGVSVLTAVDDEELAQNSKDRGHELLAGLRALAEEHQLIRAVRGAGLLCGLVLDDQVLPGASKKLHRAGMEHGVNIYLAGDGEIDGVLITPPLIITADEIRTLLELLGFALRDLETEV